MSDFSLFKIEDLGDNIGTCNCGKKWVRYYYYIRNNKTQNFACLCPDCIKLLPNLAAVTDLLQVFLYGVTATYVGESNHNQHVFAVNKSFPFYKRKNEIAQEFETIPIRTYRDIAVVVVQHQDKVKLFEDTYYEIKLRPVIRARVLTFELIAATSLSFTNYSPPLLTVSSPTNTPLPRYNPVLPINFYFPAPMYCMVE